MIDTATELLLGLFSVSIFLAHALDAYNAEGTRHEALPVQAGQSARRATD